MTTAEKVLAALEAYGLKKEGQNRYRCNSPLRPGSNSHAFTVTIDDGEHGAQRWPEDPAQLPEWKRWWAANLAEVETAQREIVNAALEEFAALEEAQP